MEASGAGGARGFFAAALAGPRLRGFFFGGLQVRGVAVMYSRLWAGMALSLWTAPHSLPSSPLVRWASSTITIDHGGSLYLR